MGIILDLLLVAIYAFLIFLAAKKGFIRTLFDLVGTILAFAIAFQLAAPIAVSIYEQFVSERMVMFLIEKLPSAITSPETVFDPQLFLNIMPESLAALISNLNIFNGDVASAIGNVVNVHTIEQNVVAPVVTLIIRMICFVVLGIILMILVKILSRILSKFVEYTPLKKVNTILGAVLGGLRGLMIIVIISALLVVIASFTSDSSFATGVEGSKICSLVSNFFSA